MKISPLQFYKCLADDTRLKTLLLIHIEQELCVCELTTALQTSQPKISRHLAQLRACGLLMDRRAGQWVYYKLNTALPSWAINVLAITATENNAFIEDALKSLNTMGDRPLRKNKCC